MEGSEEFGYFFHDPRHDPSVFMQLHLGEKKTNEDKRRISIAKRNMPKADIMH